MVDRGGQASTCASEALTEAQVAGEPGGDQLECHGTPETELGGSVDDTHPALTGQAVDSVSSDLLARRQLSHRARQSLRPKRAIGAIVVLSARRRNVRCGYPIRGFVRSAR